MKHPKLDWEKIHDDNLMKQRGVENYNYKKPLEIVLEISCVYCGEKLKNDSRRTELAHLSKCASYLSEVKAGHIRNKHGLYQKLTSSNRLRDFTDEPNFPYCAIGRVVRTKTSTGKVTKISSDGKKITLKDDIGSERTFLIEFLLKQ
ncbi:MAG: hypothetical protein JSS81_06920 [Acidobacteria bacterium]|nr:hypothetical protein [Acidobacteriota bacterium]